MEKNGTILGKFLLSGTNDYMQRLGNPTQSKMSSALERMFDPMNQDIYNSFANFMVQRIGLAYARQQAFQSPMREFWKEKLYYGATVTETMLNWIKGHSYDQEAEDQFKQYYPEGLQAFHSVDYEQVYPITVNRDLWKQAAANEYGLNNIIAARMQQPINADEYDKTQALWNLFGVADNKYGLFREQLSAEPTTEDTCKELLQQLQQYSYDLQMPTSVYSQTDIPVFAKPDEMVLFIRSDVMAATNVQALAAAYNLDKVDIKYRLKVIPMRYWPLNETDYAILTTSDFFQCYQVDYLTTSQFNAANASTNYWLIDRAIISFSPFVPVVVFSTAEASTVDTVNMEFYSDIRLHDQYKVDAYTYKLNYIYTGGESSDERVAVAPKSLIYYVSAVDDLGNAIKLSPASYVDANGYLHIQRDWSSTNLATNATNVKIYVGIKPTFIHPNHTYARITTIITDLAATLSVDDLLTGFAATHASDSDTAAVTD